MASRLQLQVEGSEPAAPEGGDPGGDGPAAPGLVGELEQIRALERALEHHRRAALSRIAQAYTPGLLRYTRGRLGNGEAAEEVVQDVFTQVRGQLGRVEDAPHLRNLLFRLAKNRCAEVIDARRRERRAHDLLVDGPPPTPGMAGEDDGDREALRAAVSALPKLEDRVLLTLSMDFNLPLKHIAHVLGVSEGACKMRSHRARLKLKKMLEEGG